MEKYLDAERLVVKVGTGFLFDENSEGSGYVFKGDQMDGLVEEISSLSNELETILVTSGGIGMAAYNLRLEEIPKGNYMRAQLWSEGQDPLMAEYRQRFSKYGKRCAQCLINRDDLDIRKRRRNIRKNQEGFFANNVISIYNENGLTSIEEIKFGDNDMLAALLSRHMEADIMVMLSNPVEGLGIGGGKSKEKAREILLAAEPPIPMEILNGRYEKDDSGLYKPKIRELFME